MMELISIIIPVYNVEKYLSRCIESVLIQTYSCIEIILIDDGSPDRCGEICDEYSRLDVRIKVIHNENGGLSDARNTGISIAQGKYLTFLDSDDWINEKYIEKIYSLMKNTKSDIGICNFIKTSSETINIESSNYNNYQYSNYEALLHLTGELYIQMTIATGKIFKIELFNNIRFPKGKIHEDEYTTYKLIYHANKVIYTTEPLLYYWQRADSITGSGFQLKNRLDAANAFNERAEFFNDKNLMDLRDKTYKSTFYIYKEIIEYINDNHIETYRNDILKEFSELRVNLRLGKYNAKFKIGYELYYIMPMFIRMVYEKYILFKNMKFNKVKFISTKDDSA